MRWNSNLETGVEKIDIQHKEIIKRINGVLEACTQQRGKEIVGDTLNFLEKYVIEHFKDEEESQIKSGYPKYKEHKILHDNFIQDLKDLRNKFEQDGATLTVVLNMNKVVVRWLARHIMQEDKEFAKYYKSR
ncbi:bacteriohemerythrin [Defluviitalea phaphyphila]|uniref:bacteriohemerythrin n=1 Tax=Defluviitalea phaphyphila TaxID=1473580 RepID=UPI00073149AF|nr:bacteriohemerythrin [Defluviitalea phaphyphila]